MDRCSSAANTRARSRRARVSREGLARHSACRIRSSSATRSGAALASVSHLVVFSVGMPTASARTSAAAADGASPTTDPGPNCASHAARTPRIAAVFPVPAAPTSTSTHPRGGHHRPDRVPLVARQGVALPRHVGLEGLLGDGRVDGGPVEAAGGVEEAGLGVEDLDRRVHAGVPQPPSLRPSAPARGWT